MVATTGFAQKGTQITASEAPRTFKQRMQLATVTAGKGTAVGDTFLLGNTRSTDTATLYYVGSAPFDSGFVSGTNAWGDIGFAERFDITGADSSVQILGVAGYLSGSATSTSTKTASFKAWRQGPVVSLGTKYYRTGKPLVAALDSVTFNFKDLRTSATNNVIDTILYRSFATPTVQIGDSFFVGCVMGSYNWSNMGGDTLSVIQTRNNQRRQPAAIVTASLDTVMNVQNCTQFADGSWNDNYFQNTPSLRNHFYLFAVVKIQGPASVNGITKNNLTFFGNYPNPASSMTQVKFTLKHSTSVMIDVMDAMGRRIKSVNAGKLAAGTHEVPFSVEEFAAGNYVYILRTDDGDGIGAEFSVVK